MDEDDDGAISFREFMLIFRKAAAGELQEDSGLGMLAKQCEINVEEVGVGGAKDFFEAKVNLFSHQNQSQNSHLILLTFQIAAIRKTSKFEEEIREEQESRKREEEEKKQRQQSFKERAAMFGGQGV